MQLTGRETQYSRCPGLRLERGLNRGVFVKLDGRNLVFGSPSHIYMPGQKFLVKDGPREPTFSFANIYLS